MSYIVSYTRRQEHPPDLIFISETLLADNSTIALLSNKLRFRWFGVCRPDHHHRGPEAATDGTPRSHHGGIGFMLLNPGLRINYLEHDTRGALALRVHQPGYHPICVIGVYNPPQGSTLNSDGRRYSQDLMNNVAEMVTRWRRSFDDVLVLGDLNMRFGNVPGLHETEDITATTGPTRTREFRAWCQHLQLLPIHGRPPTLDPARTTARWADLALDPRAPTHASRARNTSAPLQHRTVFTSEVDYILASAGHGEERLTAIHDTGEAVGIALPSTHRPVAATVTLVPSHTAVRPPPKPRERLPRADYGDTAFWSAAAATIQRRLPAIRRMVTAQGTDPGADLAAPVAALEAMYRDAMHAGAGVHGERKDASIRRKFQGALMPPWVDALFDFAREQRKAYHAVRREAKGDPARREAVEAARQALAAANRAARDAAQRVISARFHGAIKELERSRIVNPHRMHVLLQRATGETPSTYTQSSGIPGDDATNRFTTAFGALLTETRAQKDIPALFDKAAYWSKYMPSVPTAVRTRHAPMLELPVSAHEVYLAIFPVTKALAPHLPLPGHSGCTLCCMHREQLDEWDPSDPTSPVPDLGPHLHGGKAPGSSGISAEMMRFPRHAEGKQVHDRMKQCAVLAAMFNGYLDRGAVPDTPSWTDSVITPILKKSVPGHRVDPEDPDDYRGIAAGNTLPKVFGLVLLRRLMHWCVAVGAIPSNQAGFMVNQSAEFQVFTALETLRHRKRQGQDTYLLFLDLRKAYDSVPQAALWHILRHMGVPDRLVRLLEAWNAARTCRVCVNGELSEAFSVGKGLPQGDVLSPLLFNLYITVLMRRIRDLKDYDGVTWTGGEPAPNIKDLWYADDMLGFARSREQLQLLLGTIHEWSTDWGIAIGVGTGKTNAMLVAHAAGTPQPAEPLMAGPHPVPWTAEYRYLGYNLRPDLGHSSYFNAISRRMTRANALYLIHNNVVQRLSLTTQFQLVNTLVLGCANYLLAVVPLTNVELALLDTTLRASARLITGAHRATPIQTLAADSRTPSLAAIVLQHRLRLEHTLRLLPDQTTPAVQVMRALRTWAADAPQGVGADGTWTRRTDELVRAAREVTAVGLDPEPMRLKHVTRFSATQGHRTGYAELRQSFRWTATDMTLSHAPTGHTPMEMAASLQCIGYHEQTWAENRGARLQHVLGDTAPLTPASAYGAGGDGSLLALSTRLRTRHSRVIQRFRLGTQALLMWPFAPPGNDNPEEETPRFAALLARMNSEDCHLCHADPANPWHLIANCTHEHVCRWRRRTWAAASQLLTTLGAVILAGHLRLSAAPPTAVAAARASLQAALAGADWGTMDGSQLILRLLCAAPFSAHDCRPSQPLRRHPRHAYAPVAADLPLCTAFGRLLDATRLPRHILRPYANAWLMWAYTRICELAGVYTCASGSTVRHLPCVLCAEAEEHPDGPSVAFSDIDEDDLHHCGVDTDSDSSTGSGPADD